MSDVRPSEEWLRLDPRMLLLGPVKVLRQFAFPLIIGFFGLTTRNDGGLPLWAIPVVVLGPIALGSIPWLTTRYRITDTQFLLHKGLISKKLLTAPLDRIRSVDLESSLLHRVLQLTRVEIGTGVDDSRISLDSISTTKAAELRGNLLARRTGVTAPSIEEPGDGAPADEPLAPPYAVTPPQVLAEIDWSWLRFAPFSLAKFAVVAGALGALSQLNLPIFSSDNLDDAGHRLLDIALPLLLIGASLFVIVAWLLISVTGYAVQWWGLRLVRDQGNLQLTSGLLTTKSISVEEAKVRGIEVTEPLLLRLVRGAELATLATGVGEAGVTKVLPPCPREVAVAVGHEVLETGEPLTAPLIPHGRAAWRRCHLRAQYATAVLTASTLIPTVIFDLPWWGPVVFAVVVGALDAVTAQATYRHLGHALTARHLVSGTGAWSRQRTVLETDGIIGWSIEQSIFQRRVGLATLVATTAAGAEHVTINEVPLDEAIRIAHAATPGVLSPWIPRARLTSPT